MSRLRVRKETREGERKGIDREKRGIVRGEGDTE